MKYFHLVWSNLKRHKLRTLLTVLSILVAFVLFGLLSAIRQALVGGVSLAGADRLIVRDKVSLIQLLPEAYAARIERIPGVKGVAHQTWFGGRFQESRYFFMQCPVEPEKFLAMFPEFLVPSEQVSAWVKTRTGAIVGRKTADRLGWKVGDKIPILSSIWPNANGSRLWEFDIVGIYDGKARNTDTTAMFFRYDYFEESRPAMKGRVGWYTIRIDNPDNAVSVAQAVDREFENSPAETRTEAEGAFVQGFANQIGNISLITATIIAAVFFTILLVTGNTMAQSVRERTGEIGVLKALGFTRGQVMLLVLSESLLIALAGGGVGLLLALAFTAGGDPTGGMLPQFMLLGRDVGIGFGIALALGLVTGLMPALQAMRIEVAQALRRM